MFLEGGAAFRLKVLNFGVSLATAPSPAGSGNFESPEFAITKYGVRGTMTTSTLNIGHTYPDSQEGGSSDVTVANESSIDPYSKPDT